MKRFLSSFLLVICCVIASVLFTNIMLFASEKQSAATTLMVVIQPVRIIVVDRNLIIQKIYSNTAEDIRPLVTLNTTDGTEVPYVDSIRKDYLSLKSSINFNKAGIVYQRDNRPIQSFIKTTTGSISKFLFF